MATLVLVPDGRLEYREDIPDLTIVHPLGVGVHPISQAFGVVSVTGIIHKGIDNPPRWEDPTDVNVNAILAGSVVSTYPYGYEVPGLGSDGSPGGYGNQVHLMHDVPNVGRLYSHYAHLAKDSIRVHAGDTVVQGQHIADMDDTGISTGKHLHWEIRLFDDITRFDPMPYVDRVIAPPIPTEEEQLMAFTPQELDSLHKLAALDANGKTFAPGTPGRSVLLQLMDFYAALPSDDARKTFARRFDHMLDTMAGPVSGGAPAARATLGEWALALSLDN